MWLAEGKAYFVCSILLVKVACDSCRRLTADDARFSAFFVGNRIGSGCRSLFQNAAHFYRLLEEILVSHGFADLNVPVLLAEIKNLQQIRVVANLELPFVANSPCLNSNFKGSITAKELIKPKLLPSIFLKDIPVLDKIYQFYVTLNYREA